MDDIVKMKSKQYGITTSLPEDAVIAMAYVPYQINNTTYNPEQGISVGTMFPILNKPFVGCVGDKNE